MTKAAAVKDRLLRAQCLALACSMACPDDSSDTIIRSAQACVEWIRDAKVPFKADIRAVK